MFPAPAPARTEELAPALRLLFSHLPPDERDKRVSNALLLLERGELKPEGVIIIRGARAIEAAIVCLPIVGATALVWPPRCVENERSADNENRLVRRAAEYLKSQGVKVAQALLSVEENALGASLERNGFRHVTHLNFYRHDLESLPARLKRELQLRFESYEECEGALFCATLKRTYIGTQDCPELNGVRSTAEVILGHQSQGRFDPARWFLAFAGVQPVGVLLLTELPESGDWDLSYIGVVPEARRQGLGKEIVQKALDEARHGDAMYLSLAVDGRNLPAIELYRQLGFEPYDRREVYLAVWVNNRAR
jgi:ribosomal protein S18 acetylase RimI-like enzyme